MAEPVHVLDRFPAQHRAFDVLVDTLRRHGWPDRATALQQSAEIPPGAPRVAVIGGAKSGKSTLINALCGFPLSPVDVDVCTVGRLFVRIEGHEPAEAFTVDADGTRHQIPIADIGRFVALDGDAAGQVHHVEARVPEGVIAGIVLEDTPGAGSFEDGHRRLALEAARNADAVMFLTPVTAPITRSDLAFLAEAVQLVDRLIVLITKTDLVPDAVQTMVDDTRARLRDTRERLGEVPVIPVSAAYASDARLSQFAGVDRLVDVLHESVIDSIDRLRMHNVMRAAWVTVEALVRENARTLIAVAEPGGAQAAEKALQTFAEHAKRVEDELSVGMSTARAELQRRISDARYGSAEAWQRRIKELRPASLTNVKELEGFVLELRASLEADASEITHAAVRAFEKAVADAIVDEDGHPLLHPADLFAPGSVAGLEAPDLERFSGSQRSTMAWLRAGTSGAMMTSLIGRSLSHLPSAALGAGTLLTGPAGLLLGGLAALPLLREQGATESRQRLARWADEAHHRTSSDLMTTINLMEVRARPELKQRLREGIQRHSDTLRERVRLARSDEAERDKHKKTLQDKQASLDMLRSVLITFLGPQPSDRAIARGS